MNKEAFIAGFDSGLEKIARKYFGERGPSLLWDKHGFPRTSGRMKKYKSIPFQAAQVAEGAARAPVILGEAAIRRYLQLLKGSKVKQKTYSKTKIKKGKNKGKRLAMKGGYKIDKKERAKSMIARGVTAAGVGTAGGVGLAKLLKKDKKDDKKKD